jgi:anionic cell wall polymer biosynthesis LytR-Cps2A-Psr (LCP) family protein
MVSNPVMDDFYPADIAPGNYAWDYYRVGLLPGAVHLDGVHALQYIRSRHGDLRGDFARSERQQQVLLAIKGQASHLNVADLPNIANAFNGELKTSMGLAQIRQLLSVAGDFDAQSIHRVVLLPPYTSEGVIAGQDVVIPHWEAIRPLVHQSFP